MLARKKFSSTLATTFLLLLGAHPLFAKEPYIHDGLFLRFSIGGGYSKQSAEEKDTTMSIKGGAAPVSLSIGYTVGKNLILHGTVWAWQIPDADISLTKDNVTVTVSSDYTSTQESFGIGLTYYVQKVNAFFTAVVGFSGLELEDNNEVQAETGTGFGLMLVAGKEWWVGKDWGLGAGLALDYDVIPEKNSSVVWNCLNFGIILTATYN